MAENLINSINGGPDYEHADAHEKNITTREKNYLELIELEFRVLN